MDNRERPHDPDNQNHAIGVDGVAHGHENDDQERIEALQGQRNPGQLHGDEVDAGTDGNDS